jgi:TP53 regulating kinase-like protein
MKIIKQGAEAILYLKDGNLVKERIKKNYRHEVIDISKRKYPTRRETKLLIKSKEIGVNVPNLIDSNDKDMKIVMEFIKGDLIKEIVDNLNEKKLKEICIKMGKQIALLHDHDIVHGDLTTSNMILKNDKIYFIDFGLGFFSKKVEDKAVDLHLLKQAFVAKHYKIGEKAFEFVLNGYKESKNFKEVVKRLEKVESRGRYK